MNTLTVGVRCPSLLKRRHIGWLLQSPATRTAGSAAHQSLPWSSVPAPVEGNGLWPKYTWRLDGHKDDVVAGFEKGILLDLCLLKICLARDQLCFSCCKGHVGWSECIWAGSIPNQCVAILPGYRRNSIWPLSIRASNTCGLQERGDFCWGQWSFEVIHRCMSGVPTLALPEAMQCQVVHFSTTLMTLVWFAQGDF